jgi:hypothetical protein
MSTQEPSDVAGQSSNLPAPADDFDLSAEIAARAPMTVPPPPVIARAAPSRASQLQSEKVVLAAPLSFAGSAARIWKLVMLRPEPWARGLLTLIAIVLISAAWTFVLGWYLLWGLLLVPYRLIRRGQRKQKRQALQHREMLQAINDQHPDARP